VSSPGCRLRTLGVISALGCGAEVTWKQLLAGESPGRIERDDLIPGRRALFAAVLGPLPSVPHALRHLESRTGRLLLGAFEQIESAVSDAVRRFGAARIGVVLGTSTAGIDQADRAFSERNAARELPSWFDLAMLEFGGPAELLQHVSGAGGPCYTISTACSSGAKALVSARTLLEIGICDAVVAGGADALCRLTASGFHSLQAISLRGSSPMSRGRDGLTLGEGAALFLVTREPDGVQILGAGEAMDAHHMSAPHPQGVGAERAMRAALSDAGPGEVSYLNLHGTGTPQNDAMESHAVGRVFGLELPCSSTKPLTGHTLAAAGALEAALCWLVLERRELERLHLPPHVWSGDPDPSLPALRLIDRGASIRVAGPARVASNSFGFGGSNCTLVLGVEPT